jgi:hypothetical protein
MGFITSEPARRNVVILFGTSCGYFGASQLVTLRSLPNVRVLPAMGSREEPTGGEVVLRIPG